MSTEPHRYPWQVSERPVFHPAPEAPHEPVIDETPTEDMPTEPYGEPHFSGETTHPFTASTEADPLAHQHSFRTAVLEEPTAEEVPHASAPPNDPVISISRSDLRAALLEQWKRPGGTMVARYEQLIFWMTLLGLIVVILVGLHYMSRTDGINASQDRQLVQHNNALTMQGQLLNSLQQGLLDVSKQQAYDHGRLDALQPEVKQSGKAVSQLRARQSWLERQIEAQHQAIPAH